MELSLELYWHWNYNYNKRAELGELKCSLLCPLFVTIIRARDHVRVPQHLS